ncbi:Hint domain-containing protein [Jannaschia seosinensis]|uniref:Hint domain-containing protein n=1 Tax=Jannaschia seosinensis TaxID=313367 RepID=UPI0006E130A4|nr:Hint domain-containing protein [Jannaschia seosinensis]
MRLDGARTALLLEMAEGMAELRARTMRTVAKLGRGRGAAMAPVSQSRDPDIAETLGDLIVTDGASNWSARMVEIEGGEHLLVFSEGLPPAGVGLRIAQSPASRPRRATRETICFTAGTVIDTPDGPRAVEDIRRGDRVATRDAGPQDVIWTGSRRLTAPRLQTEPNLRPVRILAGALGNANELDVSPGHLILVSHPAAKALWGAPEVLVRARDLVDDYGIVPAPAAGDVTYVHLLTRHHQVLRANGVWADSFHPGDVDIATLSPRDRVCLLDAVPDIDVDPAAYGAPARRVLSAAELAILRHEGAPRHLAPLRAG